MENELGFKNKLIQHIHGLLADKLKSIEQSLAEIRESRDADTKSSVGDKHETSRALAQTELDKQEMQLYKTLQMQKEFLILNTTKNRDIIGQGSLVFAGNENYFISIALGKLLIEDKIYYAISAASPLGKFLLGKTVGEKIIFQGREIHIKSIV